MTSARRGTALRPISYLLQEGTLVGSSDSQLLERFVAGRDETAFEALIARHGRAVHAVCRDVLRDPHDAEDAFQATFLILARKADSLWVGDSLAGWLHRVARRVAVEANRRKARRRAVEKTGLDVDIARIDSPSPWRSLMPVLHEEIDRLPEKYRVPIILCDLEELTRDEASDRLGWPPGTVAGRLARARALLRDRLVRRGEVEVAGLTAVAGSRRPRHGDVPAAWITGFVRLLTSSPAGPAVMSGGASAGGPLLARGVIRAMMFAKLKKIAVISIVAGLAPAICALAVAIARTGTTTPGETTESGAVQEGATARTAAVRHGTTAAKGPVAGAVVLQDGTPARGVRVFFSTRDGGYGPGPVRAEMNVDDQGRFSLDVPPVESPWIGMIGTGTLWGYRPGSLVATIPVYQGALPPGSPLRLVVGPPARALFEVHDPEGRPIAGVRIEPTGLGRHNALVPDRLTALIGADSVTDANGRAVVAAFFPEEIRSIRIKAEGYGQQYFHFGRGDVTPDPKIVQLRPVGRLKGRLVGDPDAIRRCPLRVTGFAPPGEPVPFSFSQDILADDDGRFDMPAIAVGLYGVRNVERCDFPWFAHDEGLGEVKPGQTTEVVLPLKRAVRVHGVVREKGSMTPIAGVRIAVAIAETGSMTTGEDGSYQGFMAPGSTFVTPRSTAPGYAMPTYSVPQLRVPEDAVDFHLPPFELMRAGEVRGLVVGERARPAVGAPVEASWVLDETRQGTGHHRLTVRTGPDGRFVVPGVPEGAEVELTARHRGFRTPDPRVSRVGEATILHLVRSYGVPLEGRVLDPDGRPVAGAGVRVRSRRRAAPGGVMMGEETVEFESGPILMVDAEGRYRTPEELEPDVEYAAYASAPGFLTSRSPWTAGRSSSYQVIRLRPVRW